MSHKTTITFDNTQEGNERAALVASVLRYLGGARELEPHELRARALALRSFLAVPRPPAGPQAVTEPTAEALGLHPPGYWDGWTKAAETVLGRVQAEVAAIVTSTDRSSPRMERAKGLGEGAAIAEDVVKQGERGRRTAGAFGIQPAPVSSSLAELWRELQAMPSEDFEANPTWVHVLLAVRRAIGAADGEDALEAITRLKAENAALRAAHAHADEAREKAAAEWHAAFEAAAAEHTAHLKAIGAAPTVKLGDAIAAIVAERSELRAMIQRGREILTARVTEQLHEAAARVVADEERLKNEVQQATVRLRGAFVTLGIVNTAEQIARITDAAHFAEERAAAVEWERKQETEARKTVPELFCRTGAGGREVSSVLVPALELVDVLLGAQAVLVASEYASSSAARERLRRSIVRFCPIGLVHTIDRLVETSRRAPADAVLTPETSKATPALDEFDRLTTPDGAPGHAGNNHPCGTGAAAR